MVSHHTSESFTGESINPQIDIPFSQNEIIALRIQIMASSGAFSDQAIAKQIAMDSKPSVLRQVVCVKLIPDKMIDPVRIATALELEQIEFSHILDKSFSDFLVGIYDVNDKIDEFHSSNDECEREFADALENQFDKDPILIALKLGLDTLESKRTLPHVPVTEVSRTIISLERAIKTQRTVLTAIHY